MNEGIANQRAGVPAPQAGEGERSAVDARIREAIAHERRAMAAEVHDAIAQTLAYVKMRMPLLDAAIQRNDTPEALRYSGDVRRAVSEAHTGVRTLLSNFRAPVDPLGLRHALQSSFEAFTNAARVELLFSDQATGLVLSATQETQLFRIVQEALNNIARHANARHAWVLLAPAAEPRGAVLEVIVEDDGCGLAAGHHEAGESHFGLGVMRQRAAALGGNVEIGARAGGGTRVCVRVPLGVTESDAPWAEAGASTPGAAP